MRVDVNGENRDLRARTLDQLLDEMGFDGPNVATALDGVFVPKDLRSSAILQEGAEVEVLSAMQGG